MNLKRLFWVLPIAFFIFYFFFLKEPSHYFNLVPIDRFSNSKIPCIPIEIGHLKLSLEVDSGFQGQLWLQHRFMDQLKNKSFHEEIWSCGVKGVPYKSIIFTVPDAKIGNLVIKNPLLKEHSEIFEQDGLIIKDNSEKPLYEKMGRVGWDLFKEHNLLIDIPNLKIGCCDSFKTLQKNGYSSYSFLRTPLLDNFSSISIQAFSQSKTLNCIIDTGTTGSVWNAAEQGNFMHLESLQIGDHDFGPLEVLPFPIKLPNPPDLILGMNFLSNHIVFIDFKERCAYISY